MDDISFVEEAMKRIHSHGGVRGTVVVNGDGIPIRSRKTAVVLDEIGSQWKQPQFQNHLKIVMSNAQIMVAVRQ